MILSRFLTFSDSAKFAQAAYSLIRNQNLSIKHSFFTQTIISNYTQGSSFSINFRPLNSYILSFVFRLLPPNDIAVSLMGYLFFIFGLILIFLITYKLADSKTALLSGSFYLLNPFFLDYAHNFSTETVFIIEALLFVYLLLFKSKIKYFSIIPLFLMYFTRPHYIIFYLSIIIFTYINYLYKKNNRKILRFSVLLLLPTFLSILILLNLDFVLRFLNLKHSAINITTSLSPSSYLRGYSLSEIASNRLLKKVFYNSYNFLKDPSRLAPVGIFIFFILGFFLEGLPEKVKKFNLFTLITLSLFILSSALTLPNARYVHPIMPLVFISSSIALVQIIKKANLKFLNLALSVVAFFILLPSIGHFTIDARFRAQKYNTQKPPVYREISRIMAQHIPKDHLIITNLDAWAAWYEDLTTMWFPLKPDMLEGHQDKVDYIVITNYKEHDADFALGEWSEVVYSPENIEDKFLSENYQVLTTFEINSDQIYENREFIGTILVSNDQ